MPKLNNFVINQPSTTMELSTNQGTTFDNLGSQAELHEKIICNWKAIQFEELKKLS